ncbi:hypothetical protein [Hymenobacter mucosus]|uniref:Uncharacterized protein n=1 Tax=Hymenobacter mucosus TaxID=1411120 RepID=A0A238YIN3_9BACT|nr:hypothetical protein [Hymenobacter mucosus]SNR70987.1 hypothetical protein SAMN06269173_105276 [Hymenobacter mucosus]
MKILVRSLALIALIATFGSLLYSIYGYYVSKKINTDEEELYTYIQTHTSSLELPSLYGTTTTLTTNVVLDSINSLLEPNIIMPGGMYSSTLDRRKARSINQRLDLECLYFLSKSNFINDILPKNQFTSIPEFYGVHIQQEYELLTSRVLDRNFGRMVIGLLFFIAWLFLFIIIIKHTSMSIYEEDKIYFRYKWSNNSNLIGRRLISLLYNTIFFVAIFSTLIFSICNRIYPNSDFDDFFMPHQAVVAICFIGMFFIWALTSMGWWVFSKRV